MFVCADCGETILPGEKMTSWRWFTELSAYGKAHVQCPIDKGVYGEDL